MQSLLIPLTPLIGLSTKPDGQQPTDEGAVSGFALALDAPDDAKLGDSVLDIPTPDVEVSSEKEVAATAVTFFSDEITFGEVGEDVQKADQTPATIPDQQPTERPNDPEEIPFVQVGIQPSDKPVPRETNSLPEHIRPETTTDIKTRATNATVSVPGKMITPPDQHVVARMNDAPSIFQDIKPAASPETTQNNAQPMGRDQAPKEAKTIEPTFPTQPHPEAIKAEPTQQDRPPVQAQSPSEPQGAVGEAKPVVRAASALPETSPSAVNLPASDPKPPSNITNEGPTLKKVVGNAPPQNLDPASSDELTPKSPVKASGEDEVAKPVNDIGRAEVKKPTTLPHVQESRTVAAGLMRGEPFADLPQTSEKTGRIEQITTTPLTTHTMTTPTAPAAKITTQQSEPPLVASAVPTTSFTSTEMRPADVIIQPTIQPVSYIQNVPATVGIPTTQMPPQDTAGAIAVQISQAIKSNEASQIELRLDPEELGRVRIILGQRDSAMLVTIIAERPETLDLMRRHSDQLTSAFSDIGYEDTDFNFDREDKPADDLEHSADTRPNEDAAHKPSETRVIGHVIQPTDGLDLRL